MGNYEEKYEQIIGLPHHVSESHAPMSMTDRAAQFSPFAALTGYDSSVNEAARLTDRREQPDDDRREMLDARLSELENSGNDTVISAVVFIPDERKDGGRYEKITGVFRRLDRFGNTMYLSDGRQVKISDLWEIDLIK